MQQVYGEGGLAMVGCEGGSHFVEERQGVEVDLGCVHICFTEVAHFGGGLAFKGLDLGY